MNWKLIFQLSIFGLIMAFATVSLIPQNIEPFFWIAIILFCAYVIAKAAKGSYFMHGFWVSMVNSVWITIVQVISYSTYVANHPDMSKMSEHLPLANHPRMLMVIMGPIWGIIFGIVLGLVAFIASKIVKPKAA